MTHAILNRASRNRWQRVQSIVGIWKEQL